MDALSTFRFDSACIGENAMKKYIKLGDQSYEIETEGAMLGGVEGATEITEKEHKAIQKARKAKEDEERKAADEVAKAAVAERGEKVKMAADELKKLGLSDDTIKLILLGL
jgi:predicted nucleotidyltransferase